MEAAVPVSYSFPSHDMAAVTHRRMMAPPPDHHNMAYYSNPAVSYASPLHHQSSYGFNHILNNHHTNYQNYFGSNPSLTPSTSRLPSETTPTTTQPLHEVPFRSVKNTLSRLNTETPSANATLHRPAEDAPQLQRSVGSEKRAPPAVETKPPLEAGSEVEFSTEVDTLMRAIQAKARDSSQEQQQEHQQQQPQQQAQQIQIQTQLPPLQKQSISGSAAAWMSPVYATSMPGNNTLYSSLQEDRVVAAPTQKQRRKYECTLPGCKKSFFQKTHLDIHVRAHTGDKPFTCKEPGCEQRFSQLGNLRTHERRHTGEKPFSCEICNKRFAQRGNVRAHKITHQQSKPYSCRLDDCGKQFTQLGNLKSHQNKFHATSLRHLTLRFASITDFERLSPQDVELFEYFASLYKNSNKGIKGRGKDRRVSTVLKASRTSNSSKRSMANKNNANPTLNTSHINNGDQHHISNVSGNITPPGSDEDLKGAVSGRGYDRMASVIANPSSYLGTPSSEEVDFHEQIYHHPQHHHHRQHQHQHPHQQQHHHQHQHPYHKGIGQ